MAGNYNVRLGPTELSYGAGAIFGDATLTLATILPVGGAARQIVTVTAGGISASLAMAGAGAR